MGVQHYLIPLNIRIKLFESTTAGIEDISEKKSRVEHDLLLADKIKRDGLDWFVDFWLNLPLFSTIKENFDIDDIKNKKTINSVTGLSNSLSGFSTGLMNSYWEDLKYLEFPVLLISGSSDKKYTSINSKMTELIKNAEYKKIEGAGHNTHLEKPALFTKFVTEFLNSLEG